MKIKIEPSQGTGKLKENLEQRFEKVEELDGDLTVETADPEKLSRIPGIKSFTVKGERRKGLAGKPVDEQAYARIDSKRDAVKALLATVEGYDLVILKTEREWDLRQLKKYNPDIKHLKSDEPPEELGIEKTISDIDSMEKIEIDMPDQEEIDLIYREKLT